MQIEDEPGQGGVDTLTAEARPPVAVIVTRFDDWRADLAMFKTYATRPFSMELRETILDRCRAIESEVAFARLDLVAGLSNALAKVAGDSQVADVELALGSIEATIEDLRDQIVE